MTNNQANCSSEGPQEPDNYRNDYADVHVAHCSSLIAGSHAPDASRRLLIPVAGYLQPRVGSSHPSVAPFLVRDGSVFLGSVLVLKWKIKENIINNY